MSNEPWAFQIFYRNSNKHPNADQWYLLLVYDHTGYIVEAYECRNGSPRKYENILVNRGLVRLIEMHVTPNCYNEAKDSCSGYLQQLD